MKHLVLILLFLVTSCNYFKVKKTTSETILKEELKAFNWNEVDQYPSFSDCDSLTEKDEKKQCFENILSNNLFQYLQQQQIVVSQEVNDVVEIDVLVSKTGALTFSNFKIDSLTLNEIPELKTYLLQSIDSLPKVFPAIKRGQQVDTQFKLPIEIKVE